VTSASRVTSGSEVSGRIFSNTAGFRSGLLILVVNSIPASSVEDEVLHLLQVNTAAESLAVLYWTQFSEILIGGYFQLPHFMLEQTFSGASFKVCSIGM